MNYLEFFHFDNHPFVSDEKINYFYPKKSYIKIINELVEFCRYKNGIFVIKGGVGVGKTVVLNKILEAIGNNDFPIFIKADEKTELLKVIANKLKIDSKNISEVLIKLADIYANGRNVIIAVDNAENLSKEEYISLNSLIQVLPNLRIILCGRGGLTKKLNQKTISPIKKHIVKKYRLRPFSILQAMKYISYVEKNALALSQYKRVISKPALFVTALFSNRNIKNINFISEKVLIDAFYGKKQKVSVKNVYNVAKNNFDVVKYNIYHKFQKIFLLILLILSIYYVIKITVDRKDLINHIEAQKSIRQQEKEIQDI
ncbi:MAG: AAA family ATPase [Alphaproteobacteria bacterium]|nr:AAA family ATPase [Alphaproteobacteria bacterium]